MSKDLLHRLGGALTIVVGAALGWFGILRPLQAAMNHAPEVRYDAKIFVVVPVCLVFGVFFLLGGGRWPYRDEAGKTLTPVGWALMAVVAVAAIGSFLGFKQLFAGLGYQAG